MNAEEIEKIQSNTSLMIWVTLIAFAFGFAYKIQFVLLAAMFGLGITLIIHAPLSLITVSRWHQTDLKTKIAFWGESFFAFGQFVCGVLAIIGAIADLTTDYLTSGEFWRQVSQSPFLFLFVFGSFCSLVGSSQIAAAFIPEGIRLSDKLSSFKKIVEGVIFLLFGLFFIGLIIFVKLF